MHANSDDYRRILSAIDREDAARSGGGEAVSGEAHPPGHELPGDPLMADLRGMVAALGVAGADHFHFSLGEIEELAAARRAQSDWHMPDHLAECPLCLEVFDLVLAGLPTVPPRLSQRLAAALPRAKQSIPFRRRLTIGRLAVAALLLVAAGYFFIDTGKHVRVQSGSVALSSGEAVPKQQDLPPGRRLVAKSPLEATFDDGSQMTASKGAQFTVDKRASLSTGVYLHRGDAAFNVVRQGRLRHFRVRTDLGEVTVVGTRFRVATATSDVIVYRSAGSVSNAVKEKRALVTVTVDEGKVLVNNRHEEVPVPAGHHATLREGQPKIDLD